jgi:Excalibur calcium-binding domain
MKKVILLTLILLATSASYAEETKTSFDKYLFAQSQPKFKCDGRQYCSQMRSCEEAKFFINNCPNTKMDGNNDGIPCEKQWCGYSH